MGVRRDDPVDLDAIDEAWGADEPAPAKPAPREPPRLVVMDEDVVEPPPAEPPRLVVVDEDVVEPPPADRPSISPTPIIEIDAPEPPAVDRPSLSPTPIVEVDGRDAGQGHALTLDLEDLEIRPRAKPSAPRLPMDLSELMPPAGAEADPAETLEPELDLPSAAGEPEPFELATDEDELDALDAVERAAAPESAGARMEAELRERFGAGDFTAALEAAEWLLRDQPRHEVALRYAQSCREVLLQMYAVRLGSLDRVPTVVVRPDDLAQLGMDHRTGFILSCIDGQTTFSEILDLSGMPPLESYRILCDLLLANVISVR